ncbi:prophenoloxidase activating factor serine proteinase [Penaeus vannamei]|uniref:Prophenoloxidase activating factor serine proteinase n=1 Tax=Penaeus vannamei TaxID=6689 RepID=A0A423SZF8_PENVA|nr:prophenoloxidase activating factor serine proteinase [Penaeus vannamei]
MCAFIPLTLSILQLIPIEASSSSFDFPLPTLSDPRRSAGVSAAGGVRLVVSLSVCLSMRSLTLFDDRSRWRPPSLRRPARGSFPRTRGKALRSRPSRACTSTLKLLAPSVEGRWSLTPLFLPPADPGLGARADHEDPGSPQKVSQQEVRLGHFQPEPRRSARAFLLHLQAEKVRLAKETGCVSQMARTWRPSAATVKSPSSPKPTNSKLPSGATTRNGGATIINDKYALTAAHCFFDNFGNRIPDEGLVVGVADRDMYSSSDDVSCVTRLVKVAKVTLHPDYLPSGYDNDITLMKLAETLDLSKDKELGAVCLPADDSKTYAGSLGNATGWGRLQYGGSQPAKLTEVTLPILEPSCWGKTVTERMLCTAYREGGKDTCQGDSGGPLYVVEGGKYFQVG